MKPDDVMAMARRHGRLLRWPGGFWSYLRPEPIPHPDVTRIPPWYVKPEVIKDLLYQGKLRVTEVHNGFATRVVPNA